MTTLLAFNIQITKKGNLNIKKTGCFECAENIQKKRFHNLLEMKTFLEHIFAEQFESSKIY